MFSYSTTATSEVKIKTGLVGKGQAAVNNWLFHPGGKYNCALARVAIGVALWLTLYYGDLFRNMSANYGDWNLRMAAAGWTPKGLIKLADLAFSGPPPQWLVVFFYDLARLSVPMMIVGLLSRPAQICAAISVTFLVSLETSYGPYWSHAFNVQLLAALIFMFARSGDALSADALIRRLFKRPLSNQESVYWWPVIFAEAAVLLFMFGAFFQKFRDSGIWWAWSDNLRNSLGISWFQYRADAPEIAVWIASNPLVWKSAGTMQLIAQSSTILAAILIRKPIFRLVFGGVFFFGEILGLGHVFRFWHMFWIPLCFLAIDYEYFWRRWIKRDPKPMAHGDRASWPSPRYRRAVIALGLFFFGYYLSTIYFRWGESHLNYPFSSMGFYSENRARPPYDESQHWLAYTGRIESYEAAADGTQKMEPVPLWSRLVALEDRIFRLDSIADLRAIDEAYRMEAARGLYVLEPRNSPSQSGYIYRKLEPVRTNYSSGLFAVPPYPEPLGVEPFHSALRAVRDESGWRAVVGTLTWDGERRQYFITVESEGFRNPRYEFLARYDVRENVEANEPSALPGEWIGDRFYVANQIPGWVYTLIRVVDTDAKIDEIYYGPDNFTTFK